MWTKLTALIALCTLVSADLAAGAAPLSITREDQREVMVTVYNGNLGLVKDVREARLPSGTEEVQWRDSPPSSSTTSCRAAS